MGLKKQRKAEAKKKAEANAQSEKEQIAIDSGNSEAVIKILEEKIAARDEVIGGYTEKHEQAKIVEYGKKDLENLDKAMGDASFLDPDFAEIAIQKNPEYFKGDDETGEYLTQDGVQLLAEKIKKEKANAQSEKEQPSEKSEKSPKTAETAKEGEVSE